MTVFADSTALLTRYAAEERQAALGRPDEIIVSVLARVEVPSAIWRKQRMGELTSQDAALLVAAFEADYFGAVGGVGEAGGFLAVPVRSAILARATRLVAAYPLRAYDAIQLASALTIAEVVPELAGFAVLDRQPRAAAAAEGLTLLPPG